jgi:hypothetical protein
MYGCTKKVVDRRSGGRPIAVVRFLLFAGLLSDDECEEFGSDADGVIDVNFLT